ncbi:hypothetical protein [Luteibacter sp. CQ10]|uniref:hypothetical protein n=1 Tax=Luteibacter sp. CQ10 TaxID=2805821 RepID=UPI0034A3EC18
MTKAADRIWGPPDADGIRASYDSPSRLGRLRRAAAGDRRVDTLLGEHRALVVDLLRAGGDALKGKTLFARAGNARHVAIAAAEYLLVHGWIELREKRRGSVWEITALRWVHADELRGALTLPRRDAEAGRRADAMGAAPLDERLLALHASLRTLATRTLLRRATLVARLDRWCAEQRGGSRNAFAQFALDDTHGMTSADWHWLARHVDLEELGVSTHTPGLLLRAPLRLMVDGGGELDLTAIPDMIALSPLTLGRLCGAEGSPVAWLLVENRTSFEEVARKIGDRYAVVWMPGYVPGWWLDAMRHLVSLVPLPALVAADPDPAGIEIALRASIPWGSNWKPLAMSPQALAATGRGKGMTDHDHAILARLSRVELDATLASLAEALAGRGRKGEQEALDLTEWLDQ